MADQETQPEVAAESPIESPTEPQRDIPISETFVPPSIIIAKLLCSESYTYHSPVPSLVLADSSVPCILGVDEAGRGPVLGPMVYAVSYMPKTTADILKTHKFDDSKKLTAGVRTSLLRATCTPGTDLFESMGWSATLMSPRDISAGMLRGAGAYNLNAQAHDTTAALIRGVIDAGVNVAEIYVDTVGPPTSYQAKLAKLFPGASVTVSKKADSIYPIVSAASVCAKVTRDAVIEVFVENESGDAAALGSGYPGDEKTKKWLRQTIDPVFGWDGRLARFSWRTVRDMLEGKTAIAATADWPDDDDEGTQKITGFFGAGGEGSGLAGWYGRPVQGDF
ncbi:ribonuclease HII-domain-containing protein [Tricharina praecox]|uniref:ribonuclease HII-domain-containing protein n=1 Tax=Tricharina praecox TaxID=43433 RepID=UPI0022209E6D|nr:ribonuclease HII-domain-containing protein [Tricharina praecox]KAI5852205.1 ribonuclease HII-domain-containing protein [Tricharina praecox]